MGKQNMNKLILIAAIAVAAAAVDGRRVSEVWTREQNVAAGIDHEGSHVTSPLPQDYIKDEDLPTNFTWGDVDGVNYLTKSLNQHIPQYCGSCWAHGSVSALGDRIKIARKAKGIDINLSVQHMLNCGNIGSCHGGSVPGPYQWIHKISKTGAGISYDTSNHTWRAPPRVMLASARDMIGPAHQRMWPGPAPPSLHLASAAPSSSTPMPQSRNLVPSLAPTTWRRRSW